LNGNREVVAPISACKHRISFLICQEEEKDAQESGSPLITVKPAGSRLVTSEASASRFKTVAPVTIGFQEAIEILTPILQIVAMPVQERDSVPGP
jgi:hypothetical protein